MSLQIQGKRFTMFTLSFNERDRINNITAEELELLNAYEFYAQSPTGQYDETACAAIAWQLFDVGIFIKDT